MITHFFMTRMGNFYLLLKTVILLQAILGCHGLTCQNCRNSQGEVNVATDCFGNQGNCQSCGRSVTVTDGVITSETRTCYDASIPCVAESSFDGSTGSATFCCSESDRCLADSTTSAGTGGIKCHVCSGLSGPVNEEFCAVQSGCSACLREVGYMGTEVSHEVRQCTTVEHFNCTVNGVYDTRGGLSIYCCKEDLCVGDPTTTDGRGGLHCYLCTNSTGSILPGFCPVQTECDKCGLTTTSVNGTIITESRTCHTKTPPPCVTVNNIQPGRTTETVCCEDYNRCNQGEETTTTTTTVSMTTTTVSTTTTASTTTTTTTENPTSSRNTSTEDYGPRDNSITVMSSASKLSLVCMFVAIMLL